MTSFIFNHMIINPEMLSLLSPGLHLFKCATKCPFLPNTHLPYGFSQFNLPKQYPFSHSFE